MHAFYYKTSLTLAAITLFNKLDPTSFKLPLLITLTALNLKNPIFDLP
jgi:hypothetical protein